MNFTEKEIERIYDELTPVETEDLFNDYLDGDFDKVKICGITFWPSVILKELDSKTYDVYYTDWLDGQLSDKYFIEVDGHYYLYDEVIDLIDEMDGEDE